MSQESFLFFAHYSGHQMHNGRLSLLIGYSQASRKNLNLHCFFWKTRLNENENKVLFFNLSWKQHFMCEYKIFMWNQKPQRRNCKTSISRKNIITLLEHKTFGIIQRLTSSCQILIQPFKSQNLNAKISFLRRAVYQKLLILRNKRNCVLEDAITLTRKSVISWDYEVVIDYAIHLSSQMTSKIGVRKHNSSFKGQKHSSQIPTSRRELTDKRENGKMYTYLPSYVCTCVATSNVLLPSVQDFGQPSLFMLIGIANKVVLATFKMATKNGALMCLPFFVCQFLGKSFSRNDVINLLRLAPPMRRTHEGR